MNTRNILGSIIIGSALAATLALTPVNAQENVWSGLVRTQFDSDALALLVPCVVLEDESGDSIPGFAPAYALNLQLEESTQLFRLVEPLQEFAERPQSCLDSLIVSDNGATATYTTTSTEVDVDAAVFADRFYTIELQANLAAQGPVEFAIINAEFRLYREPVFNGENFFIFFPAAPFTAEYIYDDLLLLQATAEVYQDLVVFEPGVIDVSCYYNDPDELLEVVDVVDGNTRHRLKSSLTSADNNKSFTLRCDVFNRDINRRELYVEKLSWFINLP